jgi:hypothetical protein
MTIFSRMLQHAKVIELYYIFLFPSAMKGRIFESHEERWVFCLGPHLP